MALKDWLKDSLKGPAASAPKGPLEVDDLIALERFDEALSQLQAKVKTNSGDLHNRLKLADLMFRTGQRSEALDEYLAIVDAYAREGLFEKSNALLAKLWRLAPNHDQVKRKMESVRRAEQLEEKRQVVVASLRRSAKAGEEGTKTFEVQNIWRDLSRCHLIEELDDERLRRFFGAVEPFHLDSGESLVQAGEHVEEIYIIAQGVIEARIVLANGIETVLRTFDGGDVIGDRALLEHQPWAASYAAPQKAILLRLTRAGLQQALTGDSDPKGLLDALRKQRHDQDVAGSTRQTERSD